MTGKEYLYQILNRETVDTGFNSSARAAADQLQPTIQDWAGTWLHSLEPSGSFAKGTANRTGTDIDLFISLRSGITLTLKEIYNSLYDHMKKEGFSPKKQNVSINVRLTRDNKPYDVDLVPAKQQTDFTTDHSLYRNRADTWTKTNVKTHIKTVKNSGRQSETRILKLWRNQKGIDFPSFYLQLVTIEALKGKYGDLPTNVMAVFEYLRDTFPHARFQDPANGNNIISDDLTQQGKDAIKVAANAARAASTWREIVK